jgi:lipid-A-disaccharide synthase
MLSAGEPSGDRLGAGLARALLRRRPDAELVGMGGEKMREAGVRLLQDAAEVAVVGIFEVLAHLPAIRRAKRRLDSFLRTERPDVLVPVDFPDFNLRLAAEAGRAGVPVVYFVSPQVWAWRRGRVKRIRHLVRRMLVLFPFETAFYEQAGVPVTFVGHPMAERGPAPAAREALCERAGLDPEATHIALLPGSRRGEVERLLPVLLEAAGRLREGRPELRFLVSAAPGLEPRALRREIPASLADVVRLHAGDYPEILAVCEAGVVAAGTASLEAAVMGLPIVVVYRMNPLSYALGRALVRVEHVAMPNLVAGRRVVPELIQGDCTPTAIAAALAAYLDGPDEARRVREALGEVRKRLGGPGIFDRAAEAVLEEMEAPEREAAV